MDPKQIAVLVSLVIVAMLFSLYCGKRVERNHRRKKLLDSFKVTFEELMAGHVGHDTIIPEIRRELKKREESLRHYGFSSKQLRKIESAGRDKTIELCWFKLTFGWGFEFAHPKSDFSRYVYDIEAHGGYTFENFTEIASIMLSCANSRNKKLSDYGITAEDLWGTFMRNYGIDFAAGETMMRIVAAGS